MRCCAFQFITGQKTTLSHRMNVNANLFDMISNNSDVDHPLCEECTDTMLETMDQQLKLAEEEAQAYQVYTNCHGPRQT